MANNSPLLRSFTSADWGSESHRRRLKFRHMIAASHHLTFFLGRRFPRAFPMVFVLGFPKSGTSWVCQLLADYFRLPFPQNSILPIGFPAVVHGHETCSGNYPIAVYVVRDGRDALTSLYFHLKGQAATKFARRMAGAAPANFDNFVCQQLRRPTATRVHWGDHVRSYVTASSGGRAVFVRYESLLQSPIKAFSAALYELTGQTPDEARVMHAVDKYAFSTQRPGESQREIRSSYLRKGQSGDWKNHFTPYAAERFAESCGDMLIASGYENDNEWVSSVGRRAA